jgi:hypothetical protein
MKLEEILLSASFVLAALVDHEIFTSAHEAESLLLLRCDVNVQSLFDRSQAFFQACCCQDVYLQQGTQGKNRDYPP